MLRRSAKVGRRTVSGKVSAKSVCMGSELVGVAQIERPFEAGGTPVLSHGTLCETEATLSWLVLALR
jgi:hypothetical protein